MTERFLGLMDKVDFSYIRFPEDSTGRVLGRRKQAHDLAKRTLLSKGIDYDSAPHGTRDVYYRNSFFRIVIKEAEMIFGEDL